MLYFVSVSSSILGVKIDSESKAFVQDTNNASFN